MAYIHFSHEQINYCQASVAMILGWFKREYNAYIEVRNVRHLDGCVYKLTTDALPDKQIRVSCIELVPGVVIIKTL